MTDNLAVLLGFLVMLAVIIPVLIGAGFQERGKRMRAAGLNRRQPAEYARVRDAKMQWAWISLVIFGIGFLIVAVATGGRGW